MHNASLYLAHQKMIEVRQQADADRRARSVRQSRGQRTLLQRLRGDG